MRTILTSLSSALAQAQRRCGPIGPLSDEWPGASRAPRRARPGPSRRAASSDAGELRRQCGAQARPSGSATVRPPRCARGAPGRGSGPGDHSSGAPIRLRRRVEHDRQQVGGGDAVDHAVVHLRDDRPAPSSSPSTIQNSQSGLLRSRSWANTRPAGCAARRDRRAAGSPCGGCGTGSGSAGRRPRPAAQAERHETHLLAVARHEGQLRRDEPDQRRQTAGRALRARRPTPICIGLFPFSMSRNIASCTLIDCIALPPIAPAGARARDTRRH